MPSTHLTCKKALPRPRLSQPASADELRTHIGWSPQQDLFCAESTWCSSEKDWTAWREGPFYATFVWLKLESCNCPWYYLLLILSKLIMAGLSEVVNDRALANVVVSDSFPPGLRDHLAMVLVGGVVLQTSVLLGGADQGTVMSFNPAFRIPRWLHVTAGLKQECKGAFQVVRS